ncbi:MAG: hypothetical protein LEGION0398_MBIBDBAK_00170 [Legionellaceae bacterium]
MSFNLKETNKWIIIAAMVGVFFTVKEIAQWLFFHHEANSMMGQIRDDFKRGDKKFLKAHQHLEHEMNSLSEQMRREEDDWEKQRLERQRAFQEMITHMEERDKESKENFNAAFKAMQKRILESSQHSPFDKRFADRHKKDAKETESYFSRKQPENKKEEQQP